MNPNIRTLDSHVMFFKKLLTYIGSSEESIYSIYHQKWCTILIILRLGLSREQKFRQIFADTVNPLC